VSGTGFMNSSVDRRTETITVFVAATGSRLEKFDSLNRDEDSFTPLKYYVKDYVDWLPDETGLMETIIADCGPGNAVPQGPA
jgi:hypothetical protein